MDENLYKNGYFAWNNQTNSLNFIRTETSRIVANQSRPTVRKSLAFDSPRHVRIKDKTDPESQAEFRKNYQRKIAPHEPDIITLQDIKNVVIFCVKSQDLSQEFLRYFHTKSLDLFLESLIGYFQFYLQVYKILQDRNLEAQRKVYLSSVSPIEEDLLDKLSQLRCEVSAKYKSLILGSGDAKAHHHMSSNNTSLSNKDLRLFERMLPMAVQVVWIALNRKSLSLIEKELNRLARSKHFSLFESSRSPSLRFLFFEKEKRILEGRSGKVEGKLKQRSPLIQELLFQDFVKSDFEGPTGILGLNRQDFDPMLRKLEFD